MFFVKSVTNPARGKTQWCAVNLETGDVFPFSSFHYAERAVYDIGEGVMTPRDYHGWAIEDCRDASGAPLRPPVLDATPKLVDIRVPVRQTFQVPPEVAEYIETLRNEIQRLKIKAQ
jgi:hypothetical protein